eukprot:12557587-Heterocapsa_arctica.AAC.1
MYRRWNSSSSCERQVWQSRGVSGTTSASLACGHVPPTRMFLSAPASFGAFASKYFSIFLGIVQSTGPVRPS